MWYAIAAIAVLLFAKSKAPNSGVTTQVIPLADNTGDNPTPNMGAISAASYSGGPNGCLECNAMDLGLDMTSINLTGHPASAAGNNAAGQGPAGGGGGGGTLPSSPGDKSGDTNGGEGVPLFT